MSSMDRALAERDARIARWIKEDPNAPGPANARIGGYGIRVVEIADYFYGLPFPDRDEETVAAIFDLPSAAVEAAVGYYLQEIMPS